MMALKTCVGLLLLSLALAEPSWKRIDTITQYVGRGETTFSKCGDEKLCLVGGRGKNIVSILDTKALSWTTGKTGPFEMHHFQAVLGPDNCVWVAGAWTGAFPDEDTVNDIWAYCRDDDEWEKRTSIPRPRGAGGAVFYDGKLYLVSGNVGGHNPDAQVVPWFDCYDPETGEWTELEDVPNPRDHFHAVVIGSKLYVAGGRFSNFDIPELFTSVAEKVDVYDFETGKWSPLEDLPRPRGGVAATVYDSTVMLLGGESGRKSAWTEVDILRDGKFVPFESMPDPRHGTGAVSCSGAVWIAGGVRVQGGGDASVETYAFFDGDTPPACTDSSSGGTSSPSSTSTGTSTSSTEISTEATSSTETSALSNDNSNDGGTSAPGENDGLDEEDDTSSNVTGDNNESTGDNNESTGDNNESTGDNNEATEDNSESSASESQTSSEQEDTESNSNRACFPSDATVQLEDGSIITLDALRIGDRVQVAHPDEYSEVFFFSHQHKNIESNSIRIETSVSDVSVTLSPGHIVYANGSPQPASTVRVGDVLSISHEDYIQATVTRVSVEVTRGLHNPHTYHGDIIVNRVVASTYTSTVHPSIARLLLLPIKAAYRTFGASAKMVSLNKMVLRTLDQTFWRR